MPSKRVAFLTCKELPNLEESDRRVVELLKTDYDIDAFPVQWDDPNTMEILKSCDLTIVRNTWDYHTRVEEFLSTLQKFSQVTNIVNPVPIIEWNSEKSYLKDLKEVHNLSIVPTLWIEPKNKQKDEDKEEKEKPNLQNEDILKQMKYYGWNQVVIKPAIGADSDGIFRVNASDNSTQVTNKLNEHLEKFGTMMVQPFISSVGTEGELSLIYIDGEFSHSVIKRPASSDYRVQEKYKGTTESVNLRNIEQENNNNTKFTQECISLGQKVIDLALKEKMTAQQFPPLYARVDILFYVFYDSVNNNNNNNNDEIQNSISSSSFVITEVELIEPSLFYQIIPEAAHRFAKAIVNRL